MCLPEGEYNIFHVATNLPVTRNDCDPAVVTVAHRSSVPVSQRYSFTSQLNGAVMHIGVAADSIVEWTLEETDTWTLTPLSGSIYRISPPSRGGYAYALPDLPDDNTVLTPVPFNGLLGCHRIVSLNDTGGIPGTEWNFVKPLSAGVYRIFNLDLGLYVVRTIPGSTALPQPISVRVDRADGQPHAEYTLSLEAVIPEREFIGVHTDSAGVNTVQWTLDDTQRWFIHITRPGETDADHIYRIAPALQGFHPVAEQYRGNENGILGAQTKVALHQVCPRDSSRWRFEPVGLFEGHLLMQIIEFATELKNVDVYELER